jgi:uncharacterized protein YidB (DUF937 family)
MKKTWLIILAVVALAALTIGVAVPALAGNGNGPATTANAAAYVDGTAVSRVADALGLTADDLLARLQAGETLVDIAASVGVSTDAIVEALVAPYAARLDQLVQDGTLTQAEADAQLQEARDNAASFLTADLSNPGDFSAWHDQMEEYCEPLMNGTGGYRFGGMMNGFANGNCWAGQDVTPGNAGAPRVNAGSGMMKGFGGRGFGGNGLGTGTCLVTQ